MTTTDAPSWLAADVDDEPATHDQPEPGERKQTLRLARGEALARAEAAEERLAGFQRREVARLASAKLAVGEDVLNLELGGRELAQLFDDDGVPDPELVRAAAAELLQRRPGLAPARRPSGSPDGGAREAPPRPRGWTQVLGTQR